MLVLRLQRVGRENTPAFRIVVSEKALSAKTGAHEIIGHYLPAENPPVFECKTDRVEYWIKNGAKPSNTLARLLKNNGMEGMEQYMEAYTKKKSKSAEPEPEAAPAPAAEGDSAPEAPKDEVQADEKPAEEAPKEEVKKEEPKAEEKPVEDKKEDAPKEGEKKEDNE